MNFSNFYSDGRTLRKDRVNSRKVDRPSKEVLSEMLNELSYCTIARKYGVSDNAVRKWVKRYEII